MSRENKLGLIIGFGIVLLVGVLISDHYSPATDARFASLTEQEFAVEAPTEMFQILPAEPLVARDAAREVRPAEDGPREQRPAPEPRAEPIIIGGPVEDFGQQIRDLLGVTSAELRNAANGLRSAAPASRATETLHVVRRGETLAGIARQYYRDTERWREIFDANRQVVSDPHLLREGMELRIPGVASAGVAASEPQPRPAAPRVQEPPARTYTIQRGDVLGVVSQKLTGTSRNWQRIYEANRDVISDPDRLIPGTVIRIPADIALPG